MSELKKTGWKQDVLTGLELVVLSLVFAGVSWGVHQWRAEAELGRVGHEETTVSGVTEVAGFPVVSFGELRKIVVEEQSKKEVVILDARADFFYENAHILGALNLDSGEFDKKFPPSRETLLRARQVIVYCSDRQCQSSKILAQKLQSVGVKSISIYPEGWEEWRKRKGAIEK